MVVLGSRTFLMALAPSVPVDISANSLNDLAGTSNA